MTTVSSRTDRAATATSWVAPVGTLFWILKLTTTAFGEAASDGLAGISPVLAVLVGMVGLVAAYRWQTRTHGFVSERYWSMVAAVAVFGTMLADGIHVALGLPYPVTSVLYAAATAAVFIVWRRSEGTISIHDINNPRRERFYWAAVMCTFALGTAVGDLTAATMGLGFGPSVVLFAILIAIPAIAWKVTGRHEVGLFWCAYVLTRPLGASIADGVAKPPSFGHGLGVGDIPVALALAALLVGLVLMTLGRRSDA
ncbi:MAG TPA: hypothetical protein VG502_20065 [Flexivirga sp.]|uniref:COG4705 family protein n=1 Tax=Flexivirga sp. TaxID=1962927 RepID=UPI002B7B83F7|nr:hypothetical protein [Flexivirga sp.]HWC24598.1 hypothetical protein [Flexivirga sp.]